MQLVFLALQMGEESAHAEKFSIAVQNEIAVLFVQVDPTRCRAELPLAWRNASGR